MQFGDKLGDNPLAVRLRDRTNWEWLEVGAENGDWGAQCRVADERMTRLRYDGRPYTREEFDNAVALARRCIDRKEERRDGLVRQAEWLVVRHDCLCNGVQDSKSGATAAALNGLLFFDADQKLSEATPKPMQRGLKQ